MSTAIAKQAPASVPALKMNEDELIGVLQGSLYPGAMVGSVKLVINYCKAAGLDPMQKPVHIVPMWDSKAKAMRDVVMPGIGLYRTQAARSGEYAGVTEPEFGEDVTGNVGGMQITYPKWCRVTVRRLLPNGTVVDFTAKELWLENYATKGRDSSAPNAMWQRRPYAQLAKCAEAQALRKAFPEFGAQPTADEMEGQSISGEIDITPRTTDRSEPALLPPYPDTDLKKNEAMWRGAFESGRSSPEHIISMISSKYALSEAQKKEIRTLAVPDEPQQPEAGQVVDADFVDAYEGAE